MNILISVTQELINAIVLTGIIESTLDIIMNLTLIKPCCTEIVELLTDLLEREQQRTLKII